MALIKIKSYYLLFRAIYCYESEQQSSIKFNFKSKKNIVLDFWKH